MRKEIVLTLFLAIAVLSAAMALRFKEASVRLYHADEGVQSYQAWRLIEEGEYRYDPQEHHGPLLYYAALVASPFLKGADGELSDYSLRMVPLAFGVGLIGFGIWGMRRYGVSTALLWGALVAVSPLCVIYGSYFVQESLFAFFTLVAAYSLFRYAEVGERRWAVLLGLALGCMQVTKETVVIHGAALALGGVYLWKRGVAGKVRVWKADLCWVLGIVVGLHVVFFSSFGANWGGVWDGVSAYFNYTDRATGQGHEKAWYYYFALLWPQVREGAHWGELSVLASVAFGTGLLWLRRDENGERRFARYMSIVGWSMLAAYVIIPYKNPWLLLTPYVFLVYTSAWAVVSLVEEGRERAGAMRLILVGAGGLLGLWMAMDIGFSTRSAVYRYPSSNRNPYLYMHTTPRYARLLDRLEQLRGALGEEFRLSVYSPDAAWPLAWHLRNWDGVGYWKDLGEVSGDGIDLIDTRLWEGREADAAEEGVFWELHGLRPNTLLLLRVEGAGVDVIMGGR